MEEGDVIITTTYNPIKRWGAIVGIFLGAGIGLTTAILVETPKVFEEIVWKYILSWIVVGFLIGWGIHCAIKE